MLDPLCGVGTIPFEACLQGRIGIGNDLSELAYVVTKAKIEKPNRSGVEDVVHQLDEYIKRIRGSSPPQHMKTLGSMGSFHNISRMRPTRKFCARGIFS